MTETMASIAEGLGGETETVLSLWKGPIEAPTPRVRIPMKDIMQDTADKYGLKVSDLTGPSRARRIARPRQEVMWLARQHTLLSYPQIGRYLGGRDHTSAIHGFKAHAKRLMAAE